MQNGSIVGLLIDGVARETMLFAAIWFLVGGIDDLLVDCVFAWHLIGDRMTGRNTRPTLADMPERPDFHIAVFVAAWDESQVIATMLRTAVSRFGTSADLRLYVGAYPNDPATVRVVAQVAAESPCVRLVVGEAPGPSTKADCLNAIWRAMLRDERAEGRRFDAVALHDAEDLVHRGELRVFAWYLDRCHAVQLPVLPLPHPRSRLVSGHYCDEFAEAHTKALVVRARVGAGLPFAGVGCAMRRDVLAKIAEARGGMPFDASSLTEDYELGLTVAAMGGSAVLARVPEHAGGPPVAVRAYFPDRMRAAVRQKARWMTGIALAGWDRVGWSAPGRIADHWMRMRDRRATLAIPVLAVAYCALVAWGISTGLHIAQSTPTPGLDPQMRLLLTANLILLGWRMAVRAGLTTRAYGWREGLWSVPRAPVSNLIALLAARRALFLYVTTLTGAVPQWDKTQHQFPDEPDRATA